MSNDIKTHVMSRLSIAFADTASFNNKDVNKLFNLDQITEENLSNKFDISGLVSDQAIDLGNITSPTIVIVRATSLLDGTGGTTENDPAAIKFKVGSGTIFDCHFMAFFVDVDSLTGKVTTDIKITTVANSDTIVEVFVAGAKA